MFDAILHTKWKKGKNDYEIIHYWAEDLSDIIFEVPPQLRDEIIEMQNWLADKYISMEQTSKSLDMQKRFFK